MDNFTFHNPTKILFGRGMENAVGAEVVRHSRRILLHFGGGSIKTSGLYDRVAASLKQAGVEWVELGGVKPNPRLGLVHEGVKLCREHRLDLRARGRRRQRDRFGQGDRHGRRQRRRSVGLFRRQARADPRLCRWRRS